MELPQHLLSSLLLVHLLLPFGCGMLLLAGAWNSLRQPRQIVWAVCLLMIVTSATLTWSVLPTDLFPDASGLQTDQPGNPSRLQFALALPGAFLSPGLMDRIVWEVTPANGAFLLLLPLLALTGDLFTQAKEHELQRSGYQLLLLGTLGLLAVGDDLGSLLSGAALSILLLSLLIARFGTESKRTSAGLFLSMQIIGLTIFAAGLAMFLASIATIRSAPYGPPGETSTTLTSLTEILRTAIAQHPAVEPLWAEYRLLPACLTLLGLVVMGAGFPMQVWLSEVGASSSLAEQIWLLAWTKGILLIGLRMLQEIDPLAFSRLTEPGVAVSLLGALFVSSLLFSQAYLPRIQSSALAWTQQLVFISVFTIDQPVTDWLLPVIISQLAGMVLLTISLTTISERFRSSELSSFRGLIPMASWLPGTLFVSLLVLTLTPLGLGLSQSWLITSSLLQMESDWSSTFRVLFLFSNLLALAGLVRVIQHLCTGPLRLPEMSPGLRERIQQNPAAISLGFASFQKVMLVIWGVIAIFGAALLPFLPVLRASISG